MKDYRREALPTEYVCDICSKPLVIKWGRFGKFLACSGFPDCKYTRSIPTGYVCPLPGCGGDVVKRKSAKRRTFYGCSNYPKCTYITNKLEKPGGEAMSEDDKINEADRETIGP
jgi:DNA topoisomerase-1